MSLAAVLTRKLISSIYKDVKTSTYRIKQNKIKIPTQIFIILFLLAFYDFSGILVIVNFYIIPVLLVPAVAIVRIVSTVVSNSL